MLEARGRHERGARALALEQRIRRDGRPVREALDRPGSDRPRGRDHGLLLPRGRRHLGGRHASVLDEDCVRERSADVDAQNAHGANVRGRPCVEGRDGGTHDGDQAPRRGRRAGRLPPHDRLPRRRRPAAEPDRRGGVDARGDAGARREPGDDGARLRGPQGAREGAGARRPRRSMADLRPAVAHVLRLDEDLRPFYEAAATDPDLAWAAQRRRPDDAQPDRLRGRREDDLHDELHLVGDRAHGLEPRREPR